MHTAVNCFSFSLFWYGERPRRAPLKLNILQRSGVFSWENLRGVQVSGENHFSSVSPPRRCPPTGARPVVMNKCMSCLHSVGHVAFSPGVNHFDSHPPSSCTSPHCFHTAAGRIRPGFPPELQPINSRPPALLPLFLRRKSIGSVRAGPCPMR